MTTWPMTLTWLAAAYAATVVNTSIFPHLAIGGAVPDALAALAVVWVALGRGDNRFIAAAGAGLLADLDCSGRLGMGMACYLIVGFLLQHALERMAYHHPLARWSLLPLAVVGLLVTTSTGRWLAGDTALPLANVLEQATTAGVYTAAIALAGLASSTMVLKRGVPGVLRS